MVSECPFCRITQGNEPAFIVHSTEHVIGFLPLRMEAPGHTVVAPRDHVEDMYDAASPQLMTLIEEVQAIAVRYRSQFGATGFNLLHASGRDAQQSVRHLHVHLIPRWPDDGLDTWPGFPLVEIDRQREYERLTLLR
jgi:histidine triad (HIT) family protein